MTTKRNRLRRRRRKRLLWRARQCIFILACLMLVLALGSGIINIFRFHGASSAEKQVLKHTNQYPDELVELLKENEETEQFVADYSKYGNKHFKISLKSDYQEGEIPYLCQWDKRWGYEKYNNSYLAIKGSAPACLSMVSVGITGDLNANPLAIAQYIEENGYLTSKEEESPSFMTEGAEYFDVQGTEINVTKETMTTALEANQPLIAQVKKGDFTKDKEHYIVIYDKDKKGNFKVHDPNSLKNSEKTWDFDTLEKQITHLWAYTVL